jgi:hypothetical protein
VDAGRGRDVEREIRRIAQPESRSGTGHVQHREWKETDQSPPRGQTGCLCPSEQPSRSLRPLFPSFASHPSSSSSPFHLQRSSPSSSSFSPFYVITIFFFFSSTSSTSSSSSFIFFHHLQSLSSPAGDLPAVLSNTTRPFFPSFPLNLSVQSPCPFFPRRAVSLILAASLIPHTICVRSAH